MNKLRTVNAEGLRQIRSFLADHHVRGDNFSEQMLNAWATDAEYEIRRGKPAAIELPGWLSVTGHVERYTISDDGLSSSMFAREAGLKGE